MHLRRKVRNRILLLAIVVLAFICWRGLRATTAAAFDCHYKLVYAVCTPKVKNAKPPSLLEIGKAGIKF